MNLIRIVKNHKATIWLAVFLVTGMTWLVAPSLNHMLAARTTMISEYETVLQPYSALYRTADALAAVSLIAAAIYLRRKLAGYARWLMPALVLVGGLMLIDPIVTTDCVVQAGRCLDSSSLASTIHNSESGILAGLLFIVALYDGIRRRRPASSAYVIICLAYAGLATANLMTEYRLETLSQYVYQTATLLWLGWLVASFRAIPETTKLADKRVRRSFAIWAYANGVLAIIVGLAHIRLLGPIENVYFGTDTAWLAQHGVIAGLFMLYISRHLWRGERTARLLMLLLLAVETMKYSVISPHTGLTILYALSFVALFVSKRSFNRGQAKLTWHNRLQDVTNILLGALLVTIIALTILSRHPHRFEAVRQVSGHFSHYVASGERRTHHSHRAPLLAHTMAAFIGGIAVLSLWALFRPARHTIEQEDPTAAADVLAASGQSSEDYFKLWPQDKSYFWHGNNAFIAYRVAGPVVFALADPVAPTARGRQETLDAFVQEWRGKGYRICFMILTEASQKLYESAGLATVRVGSSAVIKVDDFTTTTIRNKWWRWQMNRAKKAGFTHQTALPPHAPEFIEQLRAVSDAWLTRPGHEERGFALGSFDESYMQASTIQYLTDESGKVVAFANQLPTFAAVNQTTIDLMRFLPDVNNAMPFLLASTIQYLHEEGRYKTFDLGFVPLAAMRGKLATFVRQFAASRFSSSGLEQFKNKFEPDWQACYIAHDGDLADLAILALNLEKVMAPLPAKERATKQ